MINDDAGARQARGVALNVARGRLIDEGPPRALRDGPLAERSRRSARGSPSNPPRRSTLPNVIVTPYGVVQRPRAHRSVELFCDNLRRFAKGEPLLNVVDPAAGY